ncbi:MAG: YkgJ family cysteine cluster protein [Planctomycetota bacterium]
MSDAWYEDGLRFECTSCGACCTGPPGYVRFSDEEGARIAELLGVSVSTFLEAYTKHTPAGRSLDEVETEHGWDCVFLDRESVPGKAVCSIYEARPTQCRTFPWWPEHLRSRTTWGALGRACEGVGQGPVIPASTIRVSARKQQTDG